MKKYILFFSTIGLLIPLCAQEIEGAFGIDVGYLVTMGDWNKHPIPEIARETKFFNGNINYGAELEFKFVDLHLGIFINYAKLNTDKYEDYVQNHGDYVSANASMVNLGGVFKYYALKHSKHFVNVDLGMGYINFSGKETSDYGSVEFDFAKNTPNITIIIGLGYKYLLEKNVAFTITAREIINPGGINYKASGKEYDILILPVCLGIRYLF